MSYTELLDRFWAMDREFSNYERVLYLYLLHRCKSLGWPETLSVSNEELMKMLSCTRNTMRAARNTLIGAGLITYDAGIGRGECSFYSIVAEKTKKGQIETPFLVEKGQSETPFLEEKGQLETPFLEEKGQLETPFCGATRSKSATETKKGQLETPFIDAQQKEKQNKKEKNPPAPPIKKKINKKKITQSNTLLHDKVNARICTHTCENGQEEIVFKELEEEQPKKKKAPLEQNLPKSLEEVLRFFEKNASDKLPDWRDEAEAFFYHYESYGWNGTSSRKIVDWESKANLWICDKTMKYKSNQKQQSYGPTAINNTNTPRGASDEEVAELMERLLREGELEREGLSHQVQP